MKQTVSLIHQDFLRAKARKVARNKWHLNLPTFNVFSLSKHKV